MEIQQISDGNRQTENSSVDVYPLGSQFKSREIVHDMQKYVTSNSGQQATDFKSKLHPYNRKLPDSASHRLNYRKLFSQSRREIERLRATNTHYHDQILQLAKQVKECTAERLRLNQIIAWQTDEIHYAWKLIEFLQAQTGGDLARPQIDSETWDSRMQPPEGHASRPQQRAVRFVGPETPAQPHKQPHRPVSTAASVAAEGCLHPLPDKNIGHNWRSWHELELLSEEWYHPITHLAERLLKVSKAVVKLADPYHSILNCNSSQSQSYGCSETDSVANSIESDGVSLKPVRSQTDFLSSHLELSEEPNFGFVASYPICNEIGHKLGKLCLFDSKPRSFNSKEHTLLMNLVAIVEQQLMSVRLATMDKLTNVYNRRGFESLAQRALDSCLRLGQPACMLYFDLDKFKQINDCFGHAEGDTVLSDFSSLLLRTFALPGIIARLGGDEFAVFLANTSSKNAQLLAQMLEQTIKEFNQEKPRKYSICYSVGVIEVDPHEHLNIEMLMKNADMLMYKEKRQRR